MDDRTAKGQMTMKFAIVILAALILSGCGWIKGGDKGGAQMPKLYNDWTRRTPMGNAIAAKDELPLWWLIEVDSAIYRVHEDAKLIYGNRPELATTGYLVYVLPGCTLSPEQRTRSFRVNGILAAEWVPNPDVRAYVVCDAPVPDADLRNALRYGPEHIILKAVDPDRYEATKVHGPPHPLIDEVTQ